MKLSIALFLFFVIPSFSYLPFKNQWVAYARESRSDKYCNSGSAKVDFLFVVDPNSSFQSQRVYLRDHIGKFIDTLNEVCPIDYQMAVTTLDMFGGVNPPLPDSAGVRGHLVSSMNTGMKVVKSTSANPSADFASIINNIQHSDTAFWEQGLESAYQAVVQHGSEFSRPGVPLIIVFMSDSDDWSCQDQCWGNEPENNTHWVKFPLSRYTNYFQTIKANENSEVIIFPLVGLPSGSCSVEFTGARYMELQEAMGGLSKSASVCNFDMASSFNGIAKVISDRGAVFKLSNGSGGTGFSVFVNQQMVPFSPENYVYDKASNSIVFTGYVPPKGATVEIIYQASTN